MARRADLTLFGIGLAIWAAGLLFLAALWAWDRQQFAAAAATFAAFLLTGKIPAILAGYAVGGDAWVVGLAVLLPDLGSVFILYPFTHHGLNFLGRISRYLEHRIEQARAKASTQDGLVARRGTLGLLVLTLLPGGLHSPLVVMVVGQLHGLSTLQVLTPIVGAQFLMIGAYTAAIFLGFNFAAGLDPRIPWLVSGIILAVLVVLWLRNYVRWRTDRRARDATPAAQGSESEPPSSLARGK